MFSEKVVKRKIVAKNLSLCNSDFIILPYSQDVLQWILSDGVDSHFIRSIGGTLFSFAPLSWGYGYWMTYFLFLESADPGCGPLDRDDVYSK